MMNYQIVFVVLWLCVGLNIAYAIVGRDLLLTPKQGLQLNGKSIYYEEDASEDQRNQSARPWERTLKHVTYVTLFSKDAASAMAGNISKLKDYTQFLRSPYVTQHNDNTRFGDIVTLATGRLEQTDNNGSYRFVEGHCSYECDADRVWALWQVQKIRHRDINQKFRYEMKFSVSPLRTEIGGGTNKRKADDYNYRPNALQSYIQKEDDYPRNFGGIIYPEETSFAQRRVDESTSRNFRQVATNNYRQITPMPQATFMHGLFQLPPTPQQLNIGEYVHDGYGAKATPKIEHFPGVVVSRSHFPTPTTFRPNYQVKFPKPEIYNPHMKFPENSQENSQLLGGKVLQHFHHHFYGPGENAINSGEQPYNAGAAGQEVTPSFNFNYPRYTPSQYPPAPQKMLFSNVESEMQRLVRVTPVPPLKRPQLPQLYQMYPVQIGHKVPLFIYPAPQEEQLPTPRNKPFVQSEPFEEHTIRYSEPDPLYVNLDNKQDKGYDLSATQLESPKTHTYEGEGDESYDKQPDSIAAQLPPPEQNQETHIPYIDEVGTQEENSKQDLTRKSSLKDIQISTEKTHIFTPHTEQSTEEEYTTLETGTTTSAPEPANKTRTVATTTTGSTPETTTQTYSDNAITPNPQNGHFVSTSTTETPLRSLSRYRHPYARATTTSETPVLKWKVRRKHKELKGDSKAKGSSRREEKVVPSTTPASSVMHTPETFATAIVKHVQKALATNQTAEVNAASKPKEEYEVLTQKSVSKSVSIKVGSDGQEIPVFVDDEENEVKGEF